MPLPLLDDCIRVCHLARDRLFLERADDVREGVEGVAQLEAGFLERLGVDDLLEQLAREYRVCGKRGLALDDGVGRNLIHGDGGRRRAGRGRAGGGRHDVDRGFPFRLRRRVRAVGRPVHLEVFQEADDAVQTAVDEIDLSFTEVVVSMSTPQSMGCEMSNILLRGEQDTSPLLLGPVICMSTLDLGVKAVRAG